MEKERNGVKGFEARERSRRQQEKEARGRGGDPLRDSPIDKSDVSPDLSPGGTRRDPEAVKQAKNARGIGKNERAGKSRARQEYDEKMKAMKKDMADLKNRVNKLEKTVQAQAEKLKGRPKEKERGQERERENERGRGDRQRTMERGRDR